MAKLNAKKQSSLQDLLLLLDGQLSELTIEESPLSSFFYSSLSSFLPFSRSLLTPLFCVCFTNQEIASTKFITSLFEVLPKTKFWTFLSLQTWGWRASPQKKKERKEGIKNKCRKKREQVLIMPFRSTAH